MKKILVEMLRAAKACEKQVELFRKTFPDGCPLSAAGLRKAQAAGLDVLWAEKLLPPSAQAEYGKVRAAAWAEYSKVCDSADAEYNKVRAAAAVEFGKVCASAQAELDKVCPPAWDEYNKVRAAAWDEYDKVCGKELLRLLKQL